MDALWNICLGVIGSIVATLILFIGSSLYRFRYKEIFLFHLTNARTAIWQIQTHIRHVEDYYMIMQQVDILYQETCAMYEAMYPLSLMAKPQTKKAVYTLLYDIYLHCERAKDTTVGYQGTAENEARLKKIKYDFFSLDEPMKPFSPTIEYHLNIMENIMNGKTISQSIQYCFRWWIKEDAFLLKLKEDYIHPFAFRCKSKSDHKFMQQKGMTMEEYQKILLTVQKKMKKQEVSP